MTLTTKTFILGASLLCSAVLYGQTLNTLYSFGRNKLGYHPYSGVTVAPHGELYGVMQFGGAWGDGVVYELLPPSSPGGAWTPTVLHSFNSQTGDSAPLGGVGLVLGPSGVLYGVTDYSSLNDGTVFKLQPPAASSTHWREAVLHAFDRTTGDGFGPAATPILSPHSALYGTTTGGGTYNNGTVYRLSPPTAQGGSWTEQILHDFQFSASDGSSPAGALALDGNDTIYGTTTYGGTPGTGTVFQLAPTGAGGPWVEKILHSFGGGTADPSYPNGVVLGPNGVLYGTTSGGRLGESCGSVCGSVFELSPPTAPGGPWTETVLHIFTGGDLTNDGAQPNSAPVLGPNGVLYGTTYAGGTSVWGTIYEMVPPSSPGGDWTEVILYSFSGPDGGSPTSVSLGPDGNLYGTTSFGGVSPQGITNQGTVFQLVLPQNANRR